MSHRERRFRIIEDLKLLIASTKNIRTDEQLLLLIMKKYGCMRKTAIEYLKVAKCLK